MNDREMVTLCTTHEAFHRMFNTTPQYSGGSLDAPGEPTTGGPPGPPLDYAGLIFVQKNV
jgi:hypothetical protein